MRPAPLADAPLRLPSLVELAAGSRDRDGHAHGAGRGRRREGNALGNTPMDAPAASTRTLGGKGARLAWLVHNGFAVPEARVIPAEVFDAVARDALPPGHDVRSLVRLAGGREGIERAGRAHAKLRQAQLPSWLHAELARIWDELKSTAPWGLAVRSSATCEDSALSSLAGLASTELCVHGGDALADAVREVWASLVLPRALAYLAARNVPTASMAVVLQIVVEAEASGVAITREPPIVADASREERTRRGSRGRSDGKRVVAPARSLELLVNATHGLGAPLVGGVTAPDVYRVAMSMGAGTGGELRVLDRTIAHKSQALVGSRGREGTHVVDVATALRDRPALDDAHLRELATMATQLTRIGRGPWEIEFAIARTAAASPIERGAANDGKTRTEEAHGAKLWTLQARPVVESGTPEGGTDDTVWSCANLAEALPGVATPLTWSVAAGFSEVGFRRAFAALGAVVPRGTHFVANVHGRFYLNLTAFMRVAASVPGLDPATLLDLGGGGGAELLQAQIADVSTRGFYMRLPLTAARWVREQASLDGDLERFEQRATEEKQALDALDLGILTDDGVATLLRDLQRSLDRTGVLMLTCASNALGGFVALRALVARVMPTSATRIAEDLTSGGALKGWGELESARPTASLVRIAEIALEDPAAMNALTATPTPTRVDEIPAGPTRAALDRWLVAHGDRAVREAELATPRWREDPHMPLMTLAMYVERAQRGLPVTPATDEVSARADEALIRVDKKLSIVERAALRHLIARCQKFARLRERMRAWVTWTLSAIRRATLEAERRLTRRSPTLRPGDVFFCTMEEILAVLRGEPRSIERIVSLRRAEHARDLARPDPPTTFIGRPSPVRLESLGGPVLKGHGASPGVVKGPVRVLANADDAHALQPGEVLVTRTTDVGWTPLFVVAAGVVTELGGPLSHAAIVARELGVPCVVNAEGATARLRDGDWVRLDGDRGLVEILPEQPGAGQPRVATQP